MKEILIDMDNTLVDLTSELIQRYNQRTNNSESLSMRDVVKYNFESFVDRPELIQPIIESEGFFTNLRPYPGALYYFNELCRLGHKIVIVTQPSNKTGRAVDEKESWIKKHIPNYSTREITYTTNKYMIGGDIFFDDSPHHLKAWANRHPSGITCKIVFPYNKNVKTDYTFSVETAWSTFYKTVKKM